jgi:hypothetical protein
LLLPGAKTSAAACGIGSSSKPKKRTGTIFSVGPMPGAWGLICQNYFMATYGNPAGILGVASITEGLGATTAGGMADAIESIYNYPSNCVTFLRSHSGFDARHLDETKRAINELVSSPEDLAAVTHGRRMTIYYYALMFTNCLEASSAASIDAIAAE